MQVRFPGRTTNAGQGQRGLALPVVLVIVAAMAGIALALMSDVRQDLRSARYVLAEAKVEAAADAAVHMAISEIVRGEATSEAQVIRRWRYAETEIDIVVTRESSRIDLNVGAPALIKGALEVAGAGPVDAETISRAVLARRDIAGGLYFRSVGELQRVAGVTPRLFAAVAPLLTVYSAQPGFDATRAPVDVLRAAPGVTQDLAEKLIAARDQKTPAPSVAISLLRPYRGSSREIFRIRADATAGDAARYIQEVVIDLSDPASPVTYQWRRVSAPS